MRDFIRMLIAVFSVSGGESRKDAGATATEYAVLVGFIALVIVFGISFFGTQLNAYWESLAGTIAGLL